MTAPSRPPAQRTGGKGTPRRKTSKKPATGSSSHGHHQDDKNLTAALKKLNIQPTFEIGEVNMFKDDGTVIHFEEPKVQASITANVFVVNGKAEQKDLADLLPGIVRQLGPESLTSLRKLAETFGTNAPGSSTIPSQTANTDKEANDENDDDDDEIPELVENFEEVAVKG